MISNKLKTSCCDENVIEGTNAPPLSVIDITNNDMHKDANIKLATSLPISEYGENSYNYGVSSLIAQGIATFINGLTNLGIGTMHAILGIVIDAVSKHSNTNNHLILEEEQQSTYASLLFVAQPVGSIIGGLTQDFIGRKYGIMLMNLPLFASWIILYNASSAAMLYSSSILMGLSIGFLEAPSPSYICEISEPRFRGVFNLSLGFMISLGFVFVYFINVFVGWRTATFICAILPVINVPILMLLPDSPTWLLTKNKTKRAESALQWLRGWVPKSRISDEFKDLCLYVDKSKKSKEQFNDLRSIMWIWVMKLKQMNKPATVRPMVLLFLYTLFSYCAMSKGTENYLLVIFKEIKTPIDAKMLRFISVVTSLIGALCSCFLIKIYGKRRTTLIIISLCCSISFSISLGIYLREAVSFMPLVVTMMFVIRQFVNNLGIDQIPWILTGEVFPLKTRGLGIGICAALFYLISSILNKTFYSLENAVTLPGCFLVYGVIGSFGIIYIYYYLPETEGKPLSDIEEIFTSKEMKERYFKKPALKKHVDK